MKHLDFYGASDDTVCVAGVGGDEFPTDRAVFQLKLADGHGARILVAYEDEGVWSVAVAPLMGDPDDPTHGIPASWQFALFQGGPEGSIPAYSMCLRVVCDDEAELLWESGR